MNLKCISVVILTYNEEINIARTISQLGLFDEVLVVDSESDDDTEAICTQFANVSFIKRRFDNHSNQWNYGISNAKNKWILALDADYYLSEDFIQELQLLPLPSEGNKVFAAHFRYCIQGKPLRRSILPKRIVLFHRDTAKFVQDGHTQDLETNATIINLKNKIFHDDRKPLERWFKAQYKYALLETKKLNMENPGLPFADKVRKHSIFSSLLVFFYCYIWQLGILDGKYGLYYALQRTYAELLVTVMRIDQKLRVNRLENTGSDFSK